MRFLLYFVYVYFSRDNIKIEMFVNSNVWLKSVKKTYVYSRNRKCIFEVSNAARDTIWVKTASFNVQRNLIIILLLVIIGNYIV